MLIPLPRAWILLTMMWSSINISIEYKYDHPNISISLWKFANNAFTDTPTPRT